MAKENHLKGQTSPYLLQHLNNPVDWHPWGEEALEKARRENKPLLVSIGYSACHWCHVMEHESFEDEEVAYLMNKDFVCIKVDREERPDIDHLYMTAVQMVSGHGGWPLNCFALPDGRPFWGGTYFPKEQWKNILSRVASLYHDNHDEVVQQAQNLTEGVAKSNLVVTGKDKAAFSKKELLSMADNLMQYMDDEEGGTKGAPKFPLPNNHEFLMHVAMQENKPEMLNQVVLSLNKMAMGGIYDQIGGGFARYATDAKWKVPHFEKMLYDNGQLVSLYAKAWKVTGNPLYREVVYDTVSFVDRELTSPDGVFYAALDADSEGEEGKYYVWKTKEIDQVLGEEAPLVKEYYQVGKKGLWEDHKNILLREEDVESFAHRKEMEPQAVRDKMARAGQKLLDVRSKRVAPGLDNKVLTAWNAMMIEGLADAAAAFGDDAFLKRAIKAADFFLAHVVEPDGKLFRKTDGTRAQIDGFLDDYALFAKALIRLYEVTGHVNYLKQAKMMTGYAISHFSSEKSMLFAYASDESEQLAAPHYELFDNVIPASNSIMARVLFYLAHFFELPEWGQRSTQMLRDMQDKLDKYSSSFTNWGILLMHHTRPFHTVVITGPDAREKARAFHQRFLPDALIAAAESEHGASGLPLFESRFVDGKTMIYVCTMGSCKAPVEDPEEALRQMKGDEG